jgi:EAL domain-containing protein (putative c-di-GMP-specific phosphodiesterase class I)
MMEASDVSETIERVLEDTGLHPRRLTVELTESVFMSFSAHVLKQFERIGNMGVKISLDDFGTAYSSFDRLYALPITSIKIDRSLITPIAQCERSRKIVGGIIKLAADLDLLTVAEGVESEEQADILQVAEASWLQGYYFGVPAPARIALASQQPLRPGPCANSGVSSSPGLAAATSIQPARLTRPYRQ